ncbi:MAG TPA: ANTAR domain-containing protein [Telluria sp.]
MNLPSNARLRIVVVANVAPDGDGTPNHGDALRNGLLASGYDIVASLPADIFLPERIAHLRPDLIIIDTDSDGRDVLEHIVIATRHERRPIVMFTDDSTTSSMDAAMAAGVSAYIVAGLQAERVKPVLDVALSRFRQEEKLRNELCDAKQQLADRKVIDRAKGLLMTRHKLSEQAAYQKLRSMAMNKNLKLAEIAQRILDVEDLLG